MKKSLPAQRRQFVTTQWSLVAAAQSDEASRTRAREALEELCRMYWFPLYAFVRRRGYSVDDAQDLTQSFFARIIEPGGFESADRERGRFRSYLLGAMKHFLANEWHRANTKKRGGGVRFVEWDMLDPEPRYAGLQRQWDSPEQLFDTQWALEIVSRALRTLRGEMETSGKGDRFDLLKASLTGEDSLSGKKLAAQLDMSEGAVKVAVHRMRRRYRDLLRSAIAETVGNEADLEDEMHYLVSTLRRRS